MANRIKAVIFDHGGVLSRGGGKGTNEKAASRAMGLSDVIEVPDLSDDLKRGRIDNAQYIQEINRLYPNAPVRLTEKMWDEVYESLRREQLSYDFARRCQASGRQIGILSNINPAIAERLRDDGSYDGFDPLVLSCYVGCAKPDLSIYAKVVDGLPGIEPGQILLLDDQDKFVAVARSLGWHAMQAISPEQMVRDAGRLLGLS